MARVIQAWLVMWALVALVGCSSSQTNPGLFGEGTGGASGDAGGEAGAVDAGVDPADVFSVCNDVVCDEQTSCVNTTCTIGGLTRWCRKLNGTYSWVVQAFCGTPEFPFGSTLLECDDAGSRVCCVKTGNWETSC